MELLFLLALSVLAFFVLLLVPALRSYPGPPAQSYLGGVFDIGLPAEQQELADIGLLARKQGLEALR